MTSKVYFHLGFFSRDVYGRRIYLSVSEDDQGLFSLTMELVNSEEPTAELYKPSRQLFPLLKFLCSRVPTEVPVIREALNEYLKANPSQLLWEI